MTEILSDRPLIAIIDYQAGNLRSVQKALETFGANAVISSDASFISAADAVVFPGQGACDSSMRNLKEGGLDSVVISAIAAGIPYLGICLGLQLLLEESEEGEEPCLGIIKGKVKRLPKGLKIPHMGWNDVSFRSDHPVFNEIPDRSYFYFVHSYAAFPTDKDVVAGTTTYGKEFCSAIAFDNVMAVQFHPEKSGDIGLSVYKNFIDFVDTYLRP
jgi:glutamine amidotransferase